MPNTERVWEGAEVLEDYKEGAGKLKLRLDADSKVRIPDPPNKQFDSIFLTVAFLQHRSFLDLRPFDESNPGCFALNVCYIV